MKYLKEWNGTLIPIESDVWDVVHGFPCTEFNKLVVASMISECGGETSRLHEKLRERIVRFMEDTAVSEELKIRRRNAKARDFHEQIIYEILKIMPAGVPFTPGMLQIAAAQRDDVPTRAYQLYAYHCSIEHDKICSVPTMVEYTLARPVSGITQNRRHVNSYCKYMVVKEDK